MKQKEKPFTYIDTHAGAGLYKLDDGYAAQNKEWLDGAARILDRKSVVPLLDRYAEIVRACGGGSVFYPGSPLIAAALMRDYDKGFCYELHPRDFDLLESALAGDKRFTVMKDDGPKQFVSLLPPASGRACILIDPSYEIKTDYADLQEHAAAALKRFPGGTYIIWYPLLSRAEARMFPGSLLALFPGNRCRIEIQFSEENPGGRGMYGCGLIIYNPPWVLKNILENDLPSLASLLGGTGGKWSLEWKERGRE